MMTADLAVHTLFPKALILMAHELELTESTDFLYDELNPEADMNWVAQLLLD